MIRWALTQAGKDLYDKLHDDTLWWRFAPSHRVMWVETRELYVAPTGDSFFDDVNYDIKSMMWDFPPHDEDDCLAIWMHAEVSMYDRSGLHPKLGFFDGLLLKPATRKRLRRELFNDELRTYRIMRNQIEPDG